MSAHGAQVTLPTQRTIGMKLRNGIWPGVDVLRDPGMTMELPICQGHGSTPPQDVSWSTYLGLVKG